MERIEIEFQNKKIQIDYQTKDGKIINKYVDFIEDGLPVIIK
jgi:hypothetical protein